MTPRKAVFYDVPTGQANTHSLYEGEVKTVLFDFDPTGGNANLPSKVLADCRLDWVLPSASIDVRVRSKFYRDDTFSINFDFPYSPLFEEPRLSALAKRFIWLNIESLAIVSFESSGFWYGGIYWENDVPCLWDLKKRERSLPVDYALYSSRVVDKLGRAELQGRLLGAKTVHWTAHGDVYFIWSARFEQAEEVNVPTDFREFIQGFEP